MRRDRHGSSLAGSATIALALLVGLLTAAAQAAPPKPGSLPRVKSGELPGPKLLYRKPATAPQLRHRKPFSAKPLLVSGTDAYRKGEYLYQDYLFDDYGANTVPGRGTHTPGADDVASQTDGDVFYPTAERYADNAADIVELRLKRQRRATVYRITLNTLLDRDSTMIGIGIDRDRDSGEGQVPWAGGAGLTSEGLDMFVRAWGTGGKVSFRGPGVPDIFPAPEAEPGGWFSRELPRRAVRTSLRRNQITVRVPEEYGGRVGRRATHRIFAGAGLHDGEGEFLPVPARRTPSERRPASGSAGEDAPAVFNLAFRWKEPQQFLDPGPYDSIPASGVWFEAEQARRLAAGRTGDFFAEVDFGELSRRRSSKIHRPGRTRARILSSRLRLGEGVEPGTFPKYRGRLQPYLITVPPGARKRSAQERSGLTFTWHSLGGNYNQYQTYSPNQLRQFGIRRGNIVVSPLARGTDGWYREEAEVDVFEVWADVASRYRLDPRRTYPSGYSMGGYGTYKLGVEYPDLWARAYTTVAPPGEGIWIPPGTPSGGPETNTNPRLENVRWIPYMNWAEVSDELVPYAGVRAQQARFDELGLRSQLWSFTPGDHFTLATLDEWGPAAEFLGRGRSVKNPSRVDYVLFPEADRPELGLRHDSAYWVSKLRTRDPDVKRGTKTTRGAISARSLAFGEGDPPAKPLTPDTVPGLGGLNAIEGTEWGKVPTRPAQNALELELDNLRKAKIDGRRARLSSKERLTIEIESDGPGKLRVSLPGVRGASATGSAKVGRRGVLVSYGAGRTEVTIGP